MYILTHIYVCINAKSFQSCLILCNPIDCSPPSSSVHGILQARILKWAATPSSRRSSQPRDRTHISYVIALAAGSLPLYMYILYFLIFFPLWFITGYEHSSLCYTVGLFIYPSYMQQFASANPNSPFHPSPLATESLFSHCLSLRLICAKLDKFNSLSNVKKLAHIPTILRFLGEDLYGVSERWI